MSGQVFIVYGGQVHLVAPFSIANTIDKGDRWTPAELADEKNGLFGEHRRGAPKNPGDVSMLLVDQLRLMAEHVPDETAYRTIDGEHITFAAWEAESNRLARGLVGRGVAKGDRVAIYLDSADVLRWVVAYAAVHKAGAVAVPTNTRLVARELDVRPRSRGGRRHHHRRTA